MNRRFAKLENGIIKYAPSTLEVGDVIKTLPAESDYLLKGYKIVIDNRPAVDAEHHAVATGWAESESAIERTYEIREIEKVPRRWTPLAIKRAASAVDWWQDLRSALVEADLLEDFWGAQYIAEDDESYPAIYAGMVALFGEAEVIAFLDAVPQEVG